VNFVGRNKEGDSPTGPIPVRTVEWAGWFTVSCSYKASASFLFLGPFIYLFCCAPTLAFPPKPLFSTFPDMEWTTLIMSRVN